MRTKYKTISAVWKALDKGQKIFWHNESYQAVIESDNCPELKMFGNRGDHCISIRCMSNWFGSRIQEPELKNLYSIKE